MNVNRDIASKGRQVLLLLCYANTNGGVLVHLCDKLFGCQAIG